MALFNHEKQTEHLLLIKAQNLQKTKQTPVFNIGSLSMAGVCICAPVLIGVFLGKIMEKYVPLSNFSWILNFILIGFLSGIVFLGLWLKKEEKQILLADKATNKLKKK